MDLFAGFIVFLLIWWIVLFAVLPWGNAPSSSPEDGTEASAPERPRIILKFAITTLISIVIWCIVYILIDNQALNFYEMAKNMGKEL